MEYIQATVLTKCVTTYTWAAHAPRMNPRNKNNLTLTANLRNKVRSVPNTGPLTYSIILALVVYVRDTACSSRYFPTGILASASFVDIHAQDANISPIHCQLYVRVSLVDIEIFAVLWVGVYFGVILWLTEPYRS